MKKRQLFELYDLIIYFSVFMFLGIGFTNIKENLSVSIVTIIFGLLNAGYLVRTILLRFKFNKLLSMQAEIEEVVEKTLQDNEKNDLNYYKQIFLEVAIEKEILNSYPSAKIIKNAYVPKNDNSFSEIDVIAITNYGIFVIEAKNINGRITGVWNKKTLKVIHPSGNEYELNNPIEQNSNHYRHLKNLLNLKSTHFRNIVVFGSSTFIEDYSKVPPYASICNIGGIVRSMKYLSKNKEILKDYEVDHIYNSLLPIVRSDELKKEEHIEYINEFVNKVETDTETI